MKGYEIDDVRLFPNPGAGKVTITLYSDQAGRGKAKTIKWLEIYLTTDKRLIQTLFKFFFDKDYDRLYYEIRKLEKFGESEAVSN